MDSIMHLNALLIKKSKEPISDQEAKALNEKVEGSRGSRRL